MDVLIYALIFLPLLTGVAIYAFDKTAFNKVVFVLQGLLTALFLGILVPNLLSDEGVGVLSFVAGGWSKLVGVAFKVDGLSLVFIAMTLIGFWYIWLYIFPKQQKDHKYLFLLCVLQSSLIALFTNDDLFAVFILIELITIIASILITYKKDAHSVRAGLFYLMYSSWGMLLYLFGTICLYWYCGTMNIDLVSPYLADYHSQPVVSFGIAAILAGLGLKSGFFLLHFWLPQAHSSAPANISAILSGLIVKMGLFAMLRITGLLELESVQSIFLAVGIFSGIFGALLAMLQSDMKRILAYHTVSQLGLVFIGLGIHGTKNILGSYAHLFNHFTFKSLLFLAVGVIIADTGERRAKKIHGLWQWDKKLSICLGVGIVSIMGLPFTSASFSKVLIKSGEYSKLVEIALYAVNTGTIISFIKLGSTLFGKPTEALLQAERKNAHTMKALYFMTFIVLMALPLELVLSYQYMPEVLSYYGKKIYTDIYTFAGLFALAFVIYKGILLKVIKKYPHLGHGDLSFGPSVALSTGFFLIMLMAL